MCLLRADRQSIGLTARSFPVRYDGLLRLGGDHDTSIYIVANGECQGEIWVAYTHHERLLVPAHEFNKKGNIYSQLLRKAGEGVFLPVLFNDAFS